jgi:hypothetical protein
MAKEHFDATSQATAAKPAATAQQDFDKNAKLRRLEEIQQQMNDIGVSRSGGATKGQTAAPYDEFYNVRTERGFTTITIPKKSRR